MQTYKMSRSTAILIAFLMMIGIAILASSCSDEPQPEITITQVDNTIPYNWDTIHYTRIISSIGGETTSLNFNIKVTFNEEFIEIVNTEFKEDPIIFVGRWSNKYTFIIDNNYGVATVNLKTGFMTIIYQGDMKEIYTH